MKRIRLSAILLAFCVALTLFSSTAFAAEMNMDILADWGIAIRTAPEYSGVLYEADKEYYIFAEDEGYIPYVMVCYYSGFKTAEEAGEFLIDNITQQYEDLQIVNGPAWVDIRGGRYYEIDFQYTIDGFQVLDRRILRENVSRIFMFVSKEVEELDMTVGSLLEDTLEYCVFLPEFADGTYDTSVLRDLDNEIPESTEEVPSITWEEYAEGYTPEELGGRFVQFREQGVELFIPDTFIPVDLGAEYSPYSYIGYFAKSEDSLIPGIGVQYITTLNISNFAEYRQMVESIGSMVEIMGEIELNGLYSLIYAIPENGTIVIGTVLDGGVFEVSVAGDTQSELQDVAEAAAASLRTIQESEFLSGGLSQLFGH